MHPGVLASLGARLAPHDPGLRDLRRDLHTHPELSRAEVRTTRVVRQRLVAAGVEPRILPGGTGLLADIGRGDRVVALRADLDALPIPDEKDVSYRSAVAGVCHGCGHDVHTAALVGAATVLAELDREGRLPGRVRVVFQPAEEATPGGALDVVAAGGLDGVEQIFAIHCDPRTDIGQVGLRTGAITAASDAVSVRLEGPGGHTARPHLTSDLVYALAAAATELPAVLSRRLDPRAGVALVWGRIAAGNAPNAIPHAGILEGTLRCLDPAAWHEAPALLQDVVSAVGTAYGVRATLDYRRGVPPVINDEAAVALLQDAALATLGAGSVTGTEQSLGGEDFAWYLEKVPGALARLGVRRPGALREMDLHQGGFDVDERAIGLGARLLAGVALRALAEPGQE